MNLILDKWQVDFLKTQGSKVLVSGRQQGKSTITAIEAAEFLTHNENVNVLIVSRTERQSEELFLKMLMYTTDNYKSMIKRGKFKPTKSTLRLNNGSIGRCLPTGLTGEGIRGFTIHKLIVDEAQLVNDDIFTSITPMLLTTGGSIVLLGTPHGRKGFFWDAFQNKHQHFKVFHINAEENIKNRPISETWSEQQRQIALEYLERERSRMSDKEYAQEYLGEFVEDLEQFFPDDLITDRCINTKTEPNEANTYYLGCDLARLGGDQSTFEIIERDQHNRLKHVENLAKKGLLTTENEIEIINMDKIWKPRRIGIDAGAGTLGVSIFDHLMQTHLKTKLVAMNNRSISTDRQGKKQQRIFKEDMYDNLKAMMERGEIELLDNDEVKLSLKSVQWELNPNPKAQTRIRIFGNYTHIVEGLIRAAWLAREKSLNFHLYYV